MSILPPTPEAAKLEALRVARVDVRHGQITGLGDLLAALDRMRRRGSPRTRPDEAADRAWYRRTATRVLAELDRDGHVPLARGHALESLEAWCRGEDLRLTARQVGLIVDVVLAAYTAALEVGAENQGG